MPDELTQQVVATQVTAPKPEEINETPQLSPEVQAEIERLKKVKEDAEKAAKEAEEKAIYWRKQKAEARAEYFKGDRKPPEGPPVVNEPLPQAGKPPAPGDFDDYNKYVEAVVDYRADLKLAQWRQEEESKKSQTQYQDKLKDLYERLDKGYEKYPDFEEVARDPSVPITAIVRDILAESERPEDVAYYLGKNRTEAIKLSRMTPIAAAKEIARIEMEISKTNPSAVNKITNAPPPIKPVGSSEVVNKPPDKMTQKEFEQWRLSQGAKRF
jgi:hypothetical protein